MVYDNSLANEIKFNSNSKPHSLFLGLLKNDLGDEERVMIDLEQDKKGFSVRLVLPVLGYKSNFPVKYSPT